MRTAIANMPNSACKFHEDQLNDGVTIYFIVAKPRGSGPVFCSRCALRTAYIVRMDSRAVCMWRAKKQKRKYISGIAAMTASGPNSSCDLFLPFILRKKCKFSMSDVLK